MYFKRIFNSNFGKCCLLGACVSFAACEHRDEEAIQTLILEQVEKNLAAFKAKQLARCHQEAMEEALIVADSIVLARALAAKDTSNFKRPIKPVKPTVLLPVDSGPIAPLFQ